MSAEEKKIMESLAQAVKALPEGKRDYLLGYAEGVAAMAEARKTEQDEKAG